MSGLAGLVWMTVQNIMQRVNWSERSCTVPGNKCTGLERSCTVLGNKFTGQKGLVLFKLLWCTGQSSLVHCTVPVNRIYWSERTCVQVNKIFWSEKSCTVPGNKCTGQKGLVQFQVSLCTSQRGLVQFQVTSELVRAQ